MTGAVARAAAVGYARAGARLGSIALVTAVLLGAYALAGRSVARRAGIVRAWNRTVIRLVGIRLRVQGAPLAADGALLVANHISYLDIPAIGAIARLSFVAKGEVGRWPLIGWLAGLADTLFVDRARCEVAKQIAPIAERLRARRSVVLFPEGTSSRGRTVLPFKSALFEAARARDDLLVQPIAIAYVKGADGVELPQERSSVYPWVGDATLVPHLWTVLQHPCVVVDIVVRPAVAAAAFASRKALARHCQTECERGLAIAIRRTRPAAVDAGGAWVSSPLHGLLR